MKTQTALVRTNGIVELNPPSTICSDIPFVVLPGDSEYDGAVGFGQSFQNLMLLILWIFLDVRHDRRNEFFHRLMKLRLTSIALNQASHEAVNRFARFDPHNVSFRSRMLFHRRIRPPVFKVSC